jgi:hypothetical protein
VKVMEATSDDKQVLFIKVLRIFIRPGWGMYFRTRRYIHVDIMKMTGLRQGPDSEVGIPASSPPSTTELLQSGRRRFRIEEGTGAGLSRGQQQVRLVQEARAGRARPAEEREAVPLAGRNVRVWQWQPSRRCRKTRTQNSEDPEYAAFRQHERFVRREQLLPAMPETSDTPSSQNLTRTDVALRKLTIDEWDQRGAERFVAWKTPTSTNSWRE